MELKQINDHCFYFKGAVNIGYIKSEEEGILIDAGLDDSAIKKVLKQLDEKNWPLTHLFITHAHADHFGGAAYLKKKRSVKVYAPELESAIINYPKLEPIYLQNGNNPYKQLRNKFVEGKPVLIDQTCSDGSFKIGSIDVTLHNVSGHSYHMLALQMNDVLYAADSYFDEKTLNKHNIPYIIDGLETINTLEKLLTIDVKGAVPGHGDYEENFKSTVEKNIKYHQTVEEELLKIISREESTPIEKVIAEFCKHCGVKIENLTSWALYRTAVSAYIKKVVEDGQVEMTFEDNYLSLKRM
ncbi:MBL fold metallo-hydrolase [Alkalihalobacterium elongatum]|uniref:MBL fold metallo-hydrolase n=1 Tax=Alkalihalobacterium elongatum TaxID=2675466 RepID=UPI001C1F3205|nr:MBL fold metallo-hydrolase [Alkalihalobacterium elongatum]